VNRLRAVRSMLRLAARGLSARGEDLEPLPEVPRRRPSVERDGIVPEPARLQRFLRATAGGGIARQKGDDAVVSPVFPVTWETEQALELFAGLDRPLPPGVVHVEGELVSLRPISAGDRLRCRVELERADPVRRGVRLVLVARNWNAAGQLCTQGTTVFLARSRPLSRERAEKEEEDGPRPSPRTEGDPRAEPPAEWEQAASWRLRGNAGRRYAAVSGDYNPIHLWSLTARAFGFRRPILHGFCTQAMVAHALIMQRFDGDPTALRRLRIAFRSPLPLPSVARLLVGERLGQRWFRVVDESGETVYAEGTYAGGVQTPWPELRVVR
jgi:acyl dehydratase